MAARALLGQEAVRVEPLGLGPVAGVAVRLVHEEGDAEARGQRDGPRPRLGFRIV